MGEEGGGGQGQFGQFDSAERLARGEEEKKAETPAETEHEGWADVLVPRLAGSALDLRGWCGGWEGGGREGGRGARCVSPLLNAKFLPISLPFSLQVDAALYLADMLSLSLLLPLLLLLPLFFPSSLRQLLLPRSPSLLLPLPPRLAPFSPPLRAVPPRQCARRLPVRPTGVG